MEVIVLAVALVVAAGVALVPESAVADDAAASAPVDGVSAPAPTETASSDSTPAPEEA